MHFLFSFYGRYPDLLFSVYEKDLPLVASTIATAVEAAAIDKLDNLVIMYVFFWIIFRRILYFLKGNPIKIF